MHLEKVLYNIPDELKIPGCVAESNRILDKKLIDKTAQQTSLFLSGHPSVDIVLKPFNKVTM